MTIEKCFKNLGHFSAKRLGIFSLVLSIAAISILNGSIALANDPESGSAAVRSYETRPSRPASFELFDIVKQLQSLRFGEVIWVSGYTRNPLSRALFDLVQYMRNNVQIKTPDEVMASVAPYRRGDFGIWVNEDGPSNCYNTRAEVLIRDVTVSTALKFDTVNPCKITRGQWSDPYSGTDFKLASAVQVDHVVPLKNAYRSGGHAWTKDRRCHYGNFLRDPGHLLSVSGRENMSKGESGPENYIPPNSAYTCAYLANWMRIKAVWNLDFSREESIAIEKALRNSGCATSSTTLKLKDIVETRRQTLTTNVKCVSTVPAAAPLSRSQLLPQ